MGLQRGLQTGQVWSRSGSELKFNSFELDSEVGRLVVVIVILAICFSLN